jgi:hypothetical protein
VIKMNTNSSLRKRSVGFGGYSEGAADDFNKAMWSSMYGARVRVRVRVSDVVISMYVARVTT